MEYAYFGSEIPAQAYLENGSFTQELRELRELERALSGGGAGEVIIG